MLLYLEDVDGLFSWNIVNKLTDTTVKTQLKLWPLFITDDATRVTLELIDGDPTSHYINASFIKVCYIS